MTADARVSDDRGGFEAFERGIRWRLPRGLSRSQRLTAELDRLDLARLEYREREHRTPQRSTPGEGIATITARPTRTSAAEPAWLEPPRPIRTRTHALLLAQLSEHFLAIRDPRQVKFRRQALAWTLEDANPADVDYLFSFESICDEFDLGLGWARRCAMRQAVAAELERRRRFLARRGRITLSMEPERIEAELVRAARAILARRSQLVSSMADTVRVLEGRDGATFVVTFDADPYDTTKEAA